MTSRPSRICPGGCTRTRASMGLEEKLWGEVPIGRGRGCNWRRFASGRGNCVLEGKWPLPSMLKKREIVVVVTVKGRFPGRKWLGQ